ncbi:MAG: BTAD domain-containing putative transcriptional regulator [Capsulimonadales bacterium]|nr:BTAD domain-containing putative transcriptional regulator [Capsulimonadales bacterium]
MGAASWYIQMLGGLRVSDGTTVIERFRSAKFGALLAYLALNPDRLHTREELADLLWPEADPLTARANLRTGLASLRRQLEPPGTLEGTTLVSVGRDRLRIGSDVSTDVAAFERAVDAARRAAETTERVRHRERAVDLYPGPLLPGIYETWALNERERLESLYRDTLTDLADHWDREGEIGQALDYARRAVARDPLSEPLHGRILRLLMRSGQHGAARRQFAELEHTLNEQLGTRPSPQIAALLTVAPASSASSVSPDSPPHAVVPVVLAAAPIAPVNPALVEPAALPTVNSQFFGREEELAALSERLNDPLVRLITITGTGGGGKTRLAIEAGRWAASIWRVRFLSLIEVSDPGELVSRLADALQVPRSSDADLLTDVANALRTGKPTLLVLDNFESLLVADAAEAAAETIRGLLEAVPALKVLITSRQRLLIEEEHEFPLLPLETPTLPGSPTRLLEFAAVRLFQHRAQQVRPDFRLNTSNARTVAALCNRLEGIPLAIELAAGWAETLTPQQMLERLERRFDLLVSRRRHLAPRHRALRTVIESAWQYLSEDQQRFFARLSIFHGGWTAEAAEAVTGDSQAVFRLAELQDRSLVTLSGGDEPRFHLLETLREFAAERTDAAERAEIRGRHARFFLRLAEAPENDLRGPDQSAALKRLGHEEANLRAALRRAGEEGTDTETALRLTAVFWRYRMLRAQFSEGRQEIEQVLIRLFPDGNAPDGPSTVGPYAHTLHGEGCLARLQGDLKTARRRIESALLLFRSQADRKAVAMCLQNLAIVMQDGGEYEAARQGYLEALALRRELGDEDGVANALNSLGVLAFELGDLADARGYLEESIALRVRKGQSPRAPQWINLAETARHLGDRETARAGYEEAIALSRQNENRQTLATALAGLAIVKTMDGDPPETCRLFSEAVRLFREVGDEGSLAQALEYVGICLFEAKDLPRTRAIVRLWAAASAMRERIGIPVPPIERPAYERALSDARRALPAEFDDLQKSGGRMTPDAVVALANETLFAPGMSGGETGDDVRTRAGTPGAIAS